MIDIKIEYSFYLKKKYYDLISKLQEFYNDEEKLIQVDHDFLNLDYGKYLIFHKKKKIILICSHGLKSPTALDF